MSATYLPVDHEIRVDREVSVFWVLAQVYEELQRYVCYYTQKFDVNSKLLATDTDI